MYGGAGAVGTKISLFCAAAGSQAQLGAPKQVAWSLISVQLK